jgi:adenylate cyclase
MALGRTRVARVVSHSLAVTYKGKAIDARAVGRELNVRYLVEGEVRHAGGLIIVNAKVIDAGNATQLWSDRLEVDPAQATQDAAGLAALLRGRVVYAVSRAEASRASAPLPPGASAMDLAMHAWAVWEKDPSTVAADSVTGMLTARKMFDQALGLDPNLMLAMYGRAETLFEQLQMELDADHDRLVQELDEVSNRAVSADPSDSIAWFYRAAALASQWRWQAALEANSKASSLDPSRIQPFTQRAWIMLYTGQPTEAVAWVDKALALQTQSNPLLVDALLQLCRANQALGRYDEAIDACEKTVAIGDWWLGHLYLVAAYAQKGETERAAAEKLILLKEQPGVTIANLRAQRLSNDKTYLQQTETHLYAGLRKAGIPEK